MIEVRWISSMAGTILWAEVLLAWVLFRYLDPDPAVAKVSRRPRALRGWPAAVAAAVPGILFGAGVLFAAGVSPGSLVLAIFVAALEILARPAERHAGRSGLAAEWEILRALVIMGGSGWIIGALGLEVRHSVVTLPLPPGRLAAVCLGSAILLFAGRGGTHVVRGILDRLGTTPKLADGQGEDIAEYNRGRVIGNLERVLLVITVALETYEAMGLIIAAKGLIRIKEFEKRDYAEYFLIGTLTSVVVAFVLGWLLREAVVHLW